jgi:hypothetical protein
MLVLVCIRSVLKINFYIRWWLWSRIKAEVEDEDEHANDTGEDRCDCEGSGGVLQ